jgi:hypothetical protein
MKIALQYFVITVSFLLGFIFNIAAQEIATDKIILKTGEIYFGEILVRDSEIVLIKTPKGERFQFPLTSVKSIEKDFNKSGVTHTEDSLQNSTDFLSDQFCIMFDLSGRISSGKYNYVWSPGSEISISAGVKKMFNETLFAGLGIAYNFASVSSTSEIISFIPVFVRLQSNNLRKYRTAPYLSLDTGYAFSTNTTYGGGTFAKFSTGVIYKITYKMAAFGGLYARVQGFSGILTETISDKKVTYKGNSSIYDFGAKVGIQF